MMLRLNLIISLIVVLLGDDGSALSPVSSMWPSSFRTSVVKVLVMEEEPRAIGDVVQGLHGSKYQFNDAGISFEGQQFAEMGYSSGAVQADNFENSPIPNWVLRLKEVAPPNNALELFLVDKAEVKIRNKERFWEMYYAFIAGPTSEMTTVQP